MKIYIVRHGETLANKSQIMQGTIDTALTDMGVKLAHDTGKGLKDVKFDKIYSSPLLRALNTARIIREENLNSDVEIILDKRISEIDMGSWEGKTLAEITKDMSSDELKVFFTNPLKLGKIGGGESARDVCDRSYEFLLDLVKHDYDNVLIATHGFATRAMLNFLYDDKSDFWQGHVPYNCAVNIIEYKDGKFSFVSKDKIYYDKSNIIDRYKV